MIFIFAAFIIAFLASVRINREKQVLSIETTKRINGLLAIIIIFSHMASYIPYDGFGGEILSSILRLLGQGMVAPFFFFSGFGIYESIKKKESYRKTILINKLLRVWIWFLLAYSLYFVLSFIMGRNYSIDRYLLSLIGLQAIGNSNWFIFAILFVYLIVGLLNLTKLRNTFIHFIIITVACAAYVLVFWRLGYDSYWYSTIICFPLGILISIAKAKIELLLHDSMVRWTLVIGCLIILAATYIFPHYTHRFGLVFDEIRYVFMCIAITILSYTFRIKGRLFGLLGAASFSIYTYQRLPMIVLKEPLSFSHPLFWILSLALAIGIGIGTYYLQRLFDSKTINLICDRIKKSGAGQNTAAAESTESPDSKAISDNSNIKVGIILNYIGMGISILGGFYVTRIVLDSVGDYQYGLYTFANSVVTWLTIISTALNASFVRFSTIQENKKGIDGLKVTNTLYYKFFWILSAIGFTVGTAIIASLYFGHIPFSTYDWDDSRTIYALLFISLINVCLTMPMNTYSLFISFRQKFIFLGCFNILLSLSNYLGHFLLAILTRNVLWVSAFSIIMLAMQWIMKEAYCRRSLNFSFTRTTLKDNKPLLSSIAMFSGIIVLNSIVDRINSSVDKIILGSMGRPDDVTIYQLGISLLTYLVTMSTTISGTYVPKINGMVVRGETEELNALFLKISKLQIIVLTTITFGFIACGYDFMLLWVGEARVNAYYVAVPIMLLDLCPLSINSSIEIQRARNKHLFRAVFYFGSAILNVAVSVLLILLLPEGYQITGCIIGTVVSRTISHWIAMSIYNKRAMKLPVGRYFINLLTYALIGAISTGFAISLGYIPSMSTLPAIATFFIKGGTFVILFGTAILLINKEFISVLRRKLLNR